MKKILAVASEGVPWAELQHLVPTLGPCAIAFVTTQASYQTQVGHARFHRVTEVSYDNTLGMIFSAFQLAWILLKERPDVVLSTGDAPGYVALRLAKLFRAQTIWIDSITHHETLSPPGQKIGPHADLWLTQWPHLARPQGPHFCGVVL